MYTGILKISQNHLLESLGIADDSVVIKRIWDNKEDTTISISLASRDNIIDTGTGEILLYNTSEACQIPIVTIAPKEPI